MSLLFPHLLWRTAVLLMFGGVALSLSTRSSLRIPVIEGESLQVQDMPPRSVVKIAFEDTPGNWFLERRLTITLADAARRRSTFGIYPPGILDRNFLYPRYLAVAPLLRFNTPGATGLQEGYRLIMLYPPGREDKVLLGNGYSAQLVIQQREEMADPFVSGQYDLHVKFFNGEQLIAEGDVPFGGRYSASGCSIDLLGSKRYVVTDLVRDYGVHLIWLSSLLASLAFVLYLPLRCLWPHRVMVFSVDDKTGQIVAASSAKGRRRYHEALFHDLLDKICR